MKITDQEIRKDELILVLRKMLEVSPPIYYEEFNKFFPSVDKEKLEEHEQQHNKLGIATFKKKDLTYGYFVFDEGNIGISILSIIATITDILIDKRLGTIVDSNGIITGFQFI